MLKPAWGFASLAPAGGPSSSPPSLSPDSPVVGRGAQALRPPSALGFPPISSAAKHRLEARSALGRPGPRHPPLSALSCSQRPATGACFGCGLLRPQHSTRTRSRPTPSNLMSYMKFDLHVGEVTGAFANRGQNLSAVESAFGVKCPLNKQLNCRSNAVGACLCNDILSP